MSKSVIAIAGIGGAGCILLSLCMHKALDARQQRRHPVEAALETHFADRLVPPARIEFAPGENGVTAVVSLTVHGNVPMDPIAEAAGALAWSLLRGRPGEPTQLTVVLCDDVGSPRRAWVAPTPSPPR